MVFTKKFLEVMERESYIVVTEIGKFWSIKHQLDIISSDVHSSIKKKKKNYDHKPEDFLKLSLAPMAHSCLYSGLFEQY